MTTASRIARRGALVIWLTVIGCLGWARPRPDQDIDKVYPKLHAVHDRASAVAVLREYWNAGYWGMQACGPIDRTFLAIRALPFVERFVAWRMGDLAITEADLGRGELAEWLKVKPADEPAIWSMLNSTDPLARWIAVEKLKSAGPIGPRVLARLKVLEIEDDYIVMTDLPFEFSTMYSEEELFPYSAPVRRSVHQLFAGKKLPVSPNDWDALALEGIARMAREWLARPEDRETIGYYMLGMGYVVPVIAQFQHDFGRSRDVDYQTRVCKTWIARAEAMRTRRKMR